MKEEKTEYAITSVSQAMPIMSIQDAVKRRSQMVQFVQQIMEEGKDFGVIPGTGDKPTLLKPGAEKLTTFFGLTKKFEVIEKTEDWTGGGHNGELFFYYWYRCQLWRGDLLIAEGDGSCNSMEKKYRYRQANRRCPQCSNEAIIKGKQEYGGGWLCWAKRGGCGAKFEDGDQSIEGQQVGQIFNPDVADQVNTIQKMAVKRALVAATLLAVNASEFFTQDLEDLAETVATTEKPKPKTSRTRNNGKPSRWQNFLADNEITEQDALKALGHDSIDDWMKANPGKTETDAHAFILSKAK